MIFFALGMVDELQLQLRQYRCNLLNRQRLMDPPRVARCKCLLKHAPRTIDKACDSSVGERMKMSPA